MLFIQGTNRQECIRPADMDRRVARYSGHIERRHAADTERPRGSRASEVGGGVVLGKSAGGRAGTESEGRLSSMHESEATALHLSSCISQGCKAGLVFERPIGRRTMRRNPSLDCEHCHPATRGVDPGSECKTEWSPDVGRIAGCGVGRSGCGQKFWKKVGAGVWRRAGLHPAVAGCAGVRVLLGGKREPQSHRRQAVHLRCERLLLHNGECRSGQRHQYSESGSDGQAPEHGSYRYLLFRQRDSFGATPQASEAPAVGVKRTRVTRPPMVCRRPIRPEIRRRLTRPAICRRPASSGERR